jgi:hypothetical protein
MEEKVKETTNLTILSLAGLYCSLFTPITNIGASGDGAEITTFFAPPLM